MALLEHLFVIMKILLFIVSYLLGSVPFGLLFSKMVGADVRTQGSRNIGATNVNRVLGKKLGLLTLACDLLKGALAVVVAMFMVTTDETGEVTVVACGLLAVIGHMFPLYIGFKGGKGVATGLGVFLVLSPWSVLISGCVFAATVALSGFVSVGSLLASASLPLWLYFLGESKVVIGGAFVIAFLIWIKHHENVGRLIRGEEKGWKKKHDQGGVEADIEQKNN